MVNRESNVFPGILGRTCDRPCEPACRRGRIDGKPVAICRLKRVAADHRGEVRHLLPKAPDEKNGKKVALIGAGPASLTVANDLMPLGYSVTIFEKLPRPGGLMRINIPAFRLPEEVLDEEIAYITDMGVDVRYDSPVNSLGALLDSGEYDAVFVGSGAPKGKELEIPGRHETDQIFIGIEWLESIHFGHVDSVGKRVLIIGVGNTAMDCCRSAKRLGATDGQGHRPQDPQVLQGVALGARGRRRRRRGHHREPPAGPLHHRERQADRDGVRQVPVGRDRHRASSRRSSAARFCRATRWCSPSGRTTRFRSSSATSGSSSGSGTCRSSTRPRSCPRAPESSSAATPRSVPRTSSGRWSTAIRRPSPSTTTARAFRSPSGRRRARRSRAPRWGCISGRTATTTTTLRARR